MSETDLVWKARFIVTQDGGVDLPPDRQHVEGPAEGRSEFLAKLALVMPPASLFAIIGLKLKAGEIQTREAREVILLADTSNGANWLIKGNSNASAGYFYVEARIVVESPFDLARKEFYRAQEAMEAAAIAELRAIIQEEHPDAVEAHVQGSYTDDGDLSIELTAIKTGAGLVDDPEVIEELDEEARDALRYLIVTMGEGYLGENEITLEPTCIECGGTGYLLDQEYGTADIPKGWTPVQRCDACDQHANDWVAAERAARDKGNGVIAKYFEAAPSEDGENGDEAPGDYAIDWVRKGN